MNRASTFVKRNQRKRAIKRAFTLIVSAMVWGLASQPSHAVPKCDYGHGQYSVTNAGRIMVVADSAIYRCRTTGTTDACRQAAYYLEQADINLAQVWTDKAVSAQGCWLCDPEYLVNQANALARMTNRYNRAVRANGAYYQSNAHYTIEGLNTGWAYAPICAASPPPPNPNPNPGPTPNPGPHPNPYPGPHTLSNTKCHVSFYTSAGQPWPTTQLGSQTCIAFFDKRPTGFMSYKVFMDKMPNPRPQGYTYGWSNTCTQVKDQIKRNCSMP